MLSDASICRIIRNLQQMLRLRPEGLANDHINYVKPSG